MSCIELPQMAPQNINILKSYNPVVPAVQGRFKLDITDTFKFIRAGSRGLVVERPIHNLEVAGSNPEVGSIFSERYWGERRLDVAAVQK